MSTLSALSALFWTKKINFYKKNILPKTGGQSGHKADKPSDGAAYEPILGRTLGGQGRTKADKN